MNEADYEQARAERNASPARFRQYDQNDSYRNHYFHDVHPERREEVEEIEEPYEAQAVQPPRIDHALSRTATGRESRFSEMPVELQEMRTATRPRVLRRTQTQTERINTLERHPTALERIETQRGLHVGTVGSYIKSRTATGASEKDLPAFGAGKPYPPDLPKREEYVVEFDGPNDPLHAQNWPLGKKLFLSLIVAYSSLVVTFASSIFSAGGGAVAIQYGVSREVTTLGTSLYVLGYAFGPLIWAPFSELQGRRIPIIIALFGFSIFSIGVATGENLQTILLCRFFSGLFGSGPLAIVAAIFADMFDNRYRGLAIAVFSATVFCGPLIAPPIGGFIVDSYLGWRWTAYIPSFMGFLAVGLTVVFLEESYPPVILVGKAADLRRRTRNWGIHAKQEEVELDLKELIVKNTSRPLRILFTEPIVLLISLYLSFLYGILYLFLTAYALVFQGVHGYNAGVGSLPYFGLLIGVLIGFVVVAATNGSYVKKLEANNGIPVPEWRLPIVIVGGVVFAIGLFWFGWTGYKASIPWYVPTLSGLATGFGIYVVFLQLLNYIVDSYLMFAASAVAANTFLRSVFGAIFPLFATYMFEGMGIQWASTLLGCVAVALVPLPICFVLFGKRIRGKSKFAPAPDLVAERKKKEDLEAQESSGGGSPVQADMSETEVDDMPEEMEGAGARVREKQGEGVVGGGSRGP